MTSLNRSEIATRLTHLIATQEPPLSISLNGQWGTGKTFFLLRWREDLDRDGFKAIYFNAWDDDFCDDPLLAILGQLEDAFKESTLKTLTQKVTETGIKLLKKNIVSVLENKTGLTLDTGEDERNLLTEYLEQRATKDELRKQLARLSQEICNETKHPMVFIIDELDRCRPTFAVELLERVKHVFDIPNLVFVFGINREELRKSLSSIYGDINTDVYLRRFFDLEFNLPEQDSQAFARHLMGKFQLDEVFQSLSEAARDRLHIEDYQNYVQVFPPLWSALGLSLRDIDYAIRLLAVLARNIPVRTFTEPYVLGILIAMKFKNPELYHAMISGEFSTREIMDYIEGELKADLITPTLARYLDRSEGFLYCYDMENQQNQPRGEAALSELQREINYLAGTEYFVISNRAQNATEEQRNRIITAINDASFHETNQRGLANLASLIDTYQKDLRR